MYYHIHGGTHWTKTPINTKKTPHFLSPTSKYLSAKGAFPKHLFFFYNKLIYNIIKKNIIFFCKNTLVFEKKVLI